MQHQPTLRERVQYFVDYRADRNELLELLKECVADGTLEALGAAALLFESDYGGFTFNFELKAAAAVTVLTWKESGLTAIGEAVRRTPTSKNMSIATQIFAGVAAGAKLPLGVSLSGSALSDSVEKGISHDEGLK